MKLKQSKTGTAHSVGGDVLILLILIAVGAFMMLPFVYSIVQSLKPVEEIFAYPPKFFVRNPTADNYKSLSQLVDSLWIPFGRYLINSVIVTLVGTLGNVIICSMAAFALAKYNFPGNKWLYNLVVFANTLWAVIIPAVGTPLGLFLMKNFMTQIPDSVIEAATVDGAGILRIFFRVCMPLVKPAVLTLIIFCFQSLWNSTGGSYIYEEEWKLLPTILADVASSGMARMGAASAASVLMMLPPCILFIAVESRIVETMAFSGIKG